MHHLHGLGLQQKQHPLNSSDWLHNFYLDFHWLLIFWLCESLLIGFLLDQHVQQNLNHLIFNGLIIISSIS